MLIPQSSDLLSPKGDLDASVLFPGISAPIVKSIVDNWINDATRALDSAGVLLTDVKAPSAVYSFVAYKAYYNKYITMLSNPLRASIENEGSDEYSVDQIREFLKIANAHLSDYTNIIAEVLKADIMVSGSPSHHMQTEISW